MIEELLQCRCGHGISGHSGSGCEGDRLRHCTCRRTRMDVLEFAVAGVRSEFESPASDAATERYRSRSTIR